MNNPEEHFPTASVNRIVERLFESGCVLLRGCVAPESVERLRTDTEIFYAGTTKPHVWEKDFLAQGLPRFRDYLFEPRHYELLDAAFAGHSYDAFQGTNTRRVAAPLGQSRWQLPLCYHIDALFHRFLFTVNFWIPFNACGVASPNLAVVPAAFDEVVQFVGYDGGKEGPSAAPDYHYAHFAPLIVASARTDAAASAAVREHFGDRLWTPAYQVGDVMMLTNWTIHGTHVTPDMSEPRENVELRFLTKLSLSGMIEAQANRAIN